jgi:hypothetical protein
MMKAGPTSKMSFFLIYKLIDEGECLRMCISSCSLLLMLPTVLLLKPVRSSDRLFLLFMPL